MNDHDGDTAYSCSYYPQRKSLGERDIKTFHHVDGKLNDAYKEVVVAFQQGLGIVTAMGIRALLEGICVVEGIDDKKTRQLAVKIDHLKDSSGIPESIIDGLKGINFIGNDAAHRLTKTDKLSLSSSIDLLESLMAHLYETKADLISKSDTMVMVHQSSKGV